MLAKEDLLKKDVKINIVNEYFKIFIMKKYRDLKIFCLGFFSFMFANFVYENAVTEVNANRITFKEVTVKVEGVVDLDLTCKGTDTPNPSSVNRGRGSATTNNCKGKGKFTGQFPTQRFVEKDKK